MPDTWANTWSDLPEDDPIFTGGVRFVLGAREPLDITPAAEDEVEFVSLNVPGRKRWEFSQLDSETTSEESD
jgi:hypothetical protein